MTSYAARWTALLAWAALSAIAWAIFVLALLAGSAVWGSHRPSPSVGQTPAGSGGIAPSPSARR